MENKTWKEAYDKIQGRVADTIIGECLVKYSAYPTNPDGIPVDNLNVYPITGPVEFRQEGILIGILDNPTWLEIAKLANRALEMSKDNHHVFLEGIHVTILGGKLATTAEFLFGS